MPQYGGKLDNVAVGVTSLRDGDHEGGWRVVADLAARDALLTSTDAAVEGMRVLVLGDGIEYQLDAGLATWSPVQVGDPARFLVVDTVADRNSISSPSQGMLAFVRSNGLTYRLRTDLSTWDVALWGLATPGVKTLHVDLDAGDDNFDGESDTPAASDVGPLATVQAAVYKLMPPHLGTQEWREAITDDRYILVHGTTSLELREFVVKPFHRGDGALLIVADETVLHAGLVQSGGAAAPDATNKAHSTITFTTSPMTPGALADDAFVRSAERADPAIAPTATARGWEDAPVVSNTANAATVVSAGPGFFTGFSWVDGNVFDVVKPKITWTNPAPPRASFNFQKLSLCHNLGGPLVVEGFRFARATGDLADAGLNMLSSSSGANVDFSAPRTQAVRCVVADPDLFGGGAFALLSGAEVALVSALLRSSAGGSYTVARGCQGVTLSHLRVSNPLASVTQTVTLFQACLGCEFYGLSADMPVGTFVGVEGSTGDLMTRAQVRGGASWRFSNGGRYHVSAVNAHSVGAVPAILVERGPHVFWQMFVGIGNYVSSNNMTGNTGAGLEIRDFAGVVVAGPANASGNNTLRTGRGQPLTTFTGDFSDPLNGAFYRGA